jgi:hypothetical protein
MKFSVNDYVVLNNAKIINIPEEYKGQKAKVLRYMTYDNSYLLRFKDGQMFRAYEVYLEEVK